MSGDGMEHDHEAKADWAPHLRHANEADEGYIRATWESSYRNSPWAGTIPNNRFNSVVTETINQLLLRGMRLLVCSNPANPEQLLGWLAYEATPNGDVVVHAAFTKPLFRQLGIYSNLIAKAGVEPGVSFFFTHKTQSSKYMKGGKFRPEIARRRELGRDAEWKRVH